MLLQVTLLIVTRVPLSVWVKNWSHESTNDKNQEIPHVFLAKLEHSVRSRILTDHRKIVYTKSVWPE